MSMPVAKVPRRGYDTTSRSTSSRFNASRTGVRPTPSDLRQLVVVDRFAGLDVQHDQLVPDGEIGPVRQGHRSRVQLDGGSSHTPIVRAAGPEVLPLQCDRHTLAYHTDISALTSCCVAREDAMTISAFDLFKVGIGPSSSHTVGPMRAACSVRPPSAGGRDCSRGSPGVRCELFGSLGATGHGHGSVKAVVLGLEGERPDLVDPSSGRPARRVHPPRGQADAGRRAPDRVSPRRRRRAAPPQATGLPQQRDGLPRAGRRRHRAGPARVLLGRRRLRPRRGRSRQPGDRRGQHPGPLPVPHRRGTAGARAGDRAADQRHHARQRALLAERDRRSARVCCTSGR